MVVLKGATGCGGGGVSGFRWYRCVAESGGSGGVAPKDVSFCHKKQNAM